MPNPSRDKKRIKRILKKLKAYWREYPDLRLAQIIGNFSRTPDPYYFEDDQLEMRLDLELKQMEAFDTACKAGG